MLLTHVGILQQVHRRSFVITTNSVHRIRKARKYNHGLLLRHDLPFVPHSRIILGRIIYFFLNEVRADVTKALPPFLYLLIGPDYIHPSRYGARLIQFKLPSSSSEGTIS